MILILVIFTCLSCILISLFALGIVIRFTYLSVESERLSSPEEAIIITGCDSGIGFELAKHFHHSTSFKIICGFVNTNNSEGYKYLSELQTRFNNNDDRLVLRKLDITQEKDISDLVESLAEIKLFALINNAGVMAYGEFDWLTWDQIQNQLEVNLVGTLRLTKAVIPHIIQTRGRIINVSSVNDATVFPGLSIYSATKGAISIFSRGLGYELRKFGAHVVAVRLGDFARLTNIMSSHASHRQDMWNDMNDKKRKLYKDYFEEFNNHLMKNYGMTSPRKFSDSTLFKDLRRALMAKNPPTTITCAPLIFRIFYFVLELMPVWTQYYLLDWMFELGFKWRPPQIGQEQKAAEKKFDATEL